MSPAFKIGVPSLRRKILRIVRDDDIDTAADGSGQYVTIIRIGKR